MITSPNSTIESSTKACGESTFNNIVFAVANFSANSFQLEVVYLTSSNNSASATLALNPVLIASLTSTFISNKLKKSKIESSKLFGTKVKI